MKLRKYKDLVGLGSWRVSKLLKQFDQLVELELLSSIAKTQDKCYMAEQIHDIMRTLPFKAYLIFFLNELKTVTQLNQLFQSNQVEPVKLFEDLLLLYKNLLLAFQLNCKK